MDTSELIKMAQAGDENAKSRLIKENSALIWSIVKKFTGRGYDNEDLFQTGAMGLIKCIERFDESFNVKFSTYAVPMIMGEIKRFLRDDGMIKVSRTIKENAVKAKTLRRIEFEKSGHILSAKEIAEILNLDEHDVILALESSKEIESIYKTINTDNGGEIYMIDTLGETDSRYSANEEILLLRQTIKKLDEDEKNIIYLRYFYDKTQSQTAQIMGISQVQVSRLEKKILVKMKEKLV